MVEMRDNGPEAVSIYSKADRSLARAAGPVATLAREKRYERGTAAFRWHANVPDGIYEPRVTLDDGRQFDVPVKFSPINLVLDPVVGKMNLVVEIRQIVFARPVSNLVLVAARSAVAVGPVAVGFLQKLLVLALQILFEDDTLDLEVRVLVSQAGFLLSKCRVKI